MKVLSKKGAVAPFLFRADFLDLQAKGVRMIENEKLTSVFNLCEKIKEINTVFEIKQFDSINALGCSFYEVYRKEKKKLPYHINIVDLLGANENAHSRIFRHLLEQKKNGQYEILESLLAYIRITNPNFNLNIQTPTITAGKYYIDVLVRDKEYAIIIENKIHNAVDQPIQLNRYIDRVKDMGYEKNKIYVIYMPRDENKTPCDDTWGPYKEEFRDRYMQLSYRDILPWLKEYLLPDIRIGDVYLKSCIEQYIDHLEGLYSLRKINTNMNKELQKHIADALGLGISPEDNHRILTEKIDELNKVNDQLVLIKSKVEQDCMNEWVKRLSTDFPDLELLPEGSVGVKIPWNDKSFIVAIEKETNIYFGIGRHYASEVLDEEIKELVKPLMDGFKESDWWYGWKYTSFENGYKRLSALIKEVIDLKK